MRNPIGSVTGPALGIMRGLGIEIDGSNRVLKAIRTTCMLNVGIMSLYSAARATILTKTAREQTMAAIETGAHAVAQNWGAIALAGATAVGVVAGLSFANKNISTGNLSNPTERRAAIGQMGGG